MNIEFYLGIWNEDIDARLTIILIFKEWDVSYQLSEDWVQ
jgi:hypothetical protein